MTSDAASPAGVTGGYLNGEWPDADWSTAASPVDLSVLLDAAVDDDGPLATTHSLVVVHRGRIVAERYHGTLGSFVSEPTPVTSEVPLLSWSMAKTMLCIVVGMLVDEGRLDLDAPAAVPEWSGPGDPRGAITLRHLLAMRDGLAFAEDYEDSGASDVIEMLFGSGKDDMAHFAADRPLAAEPGTRYNYSSGTTNIISRLVGDHLGGGDAMARFLAERLFGPLAMTTATPTFDAAGTFVASSYVNATARDFARFGLMLCRGGLAGSQRLVSESWIDGLRVPISLDPDDGRWYSLQTWVAGDHLGTFWCNGFEGQRIVAVPPLDLVIVRTGATSSDHAAELDDWCREIIEAFEAVELSAIATRGESPN